GVSQTQVRDNLRTALHDEKVDVITGEKLTKETQDQQAKGFGPIRTFLLVFAFISVAVGGFVIYTSFSFIVAQQQRQMALLRAVGASKRPVLLSVLLESMVVGVVASLLGYALGVGLAKGLSSLIIEDSVLTLRPASFITAILVGVIVTVLSALLPAW